jgi:hypothetical protein
VAFCGFANDEDVPLGCVISPPQYMLVKLSGSGISMAGLPPEVVAIEPTRFQCSLGKGRSVYLRQFTAVYAITDYKCQGQTYSSILVDLQKPIHGCPPATSLYVQLSRVRNLNGLSIMRHFDIRELYVPLPESLLEELRWQRIKHEETLARYSDERSSSYSPYHRLCFNERCNGRLRWQIIF